MPPRPPKPVRQQLAESEAMLSARDEAMQTPDEVREAFLKRKRQLGPVYVEPFSIGILWLFEELKHPLYTGGDKILDAEGQPVPVLDDQQKPVTRNGRVVFATEPLSARDICRAIYIFHDSESAGEALSAGEDNFDQAALELVRGISQHMVGEIIAAITVTLTEGLATVPGGGAANPPQKGS